MSNSRNCPPVSARGAIPAPKPSAPPTLSALPVSPCPTFPPMRGSVRWRWIEEHAFLPRVGRLGMLLHKLLTNMALRRGRNRRLDFPRSRAYLRAAYDGSERLEYSPRWPVLLTMCGHSWVGSSLRSACCFLLDGFDPHLGYICDRPRYVQIEST